jgi:hypothetical protein
MSNNNANHWPPSLLYISILPALSQIAAMRQELEALKRKSREDQAEIERLRWKGVAFSLDSFESLDTLIFFL